METKTHFVFNARLRINIDNNVIPLIQKHLFKRYEMKQDIILPDHPFFFHGQCDKIAIGNIRESTIFYGSNFECVDGIYYISIRSAVMNRDDLIPLFCDWIGPYLNQVEGDFLGYVKGIRDRHPTLIYYMNPSHYKYVPPTYAHFY